MLDGAVLLLSLIGVGGPVRFALGVLFALLVPGWSIVGHLRLGSVALEFGLTVATSLATLMALAQLMMTAHLWHPVVLEEALAVACAVALWLVARHYHPTRDAP